MIAAMWVLAIALAAFIGTMVLDACWRDAWYLRWKLDGWLARVIVWLFAIPSDGDDRPARHPRVRAHLLAQLRPPRTPRPPET